MDGDGVLSGIVDRCDVCFEEEAGIVFLEEGVRFRLDEVIEAALVPDVVVFVGELVEGVVVVLRSLTISTLFLLFLFPGPLFSSFWFHGHIRQSTKSASSDQDYRHTPNQTPTTPQPASAYPFSVSNPQCSIPLSSSDPADSVSKSYQHLAPPFHMLSHNHRANLRSLQRRSGRR